MEDTAPGERLHRFLARAGVGSRRACEEFIAQGRVHVDGVAVTEMGVRVDPERQEVRFDGEVVQPASVAYFLVYKPKGVVCTTQDQFRRKTVVDLVRDRAARRLFPVGRLEEDSEGLILVTNDGAFAETLLGHRSPVRQKWWVKVRGHLDQEALDKVRGGVWLSDGKTAPMWVQVLRSTAKASTLLVTPTGQQHRLLRRVFAKAGVQVERVIRTGIGPLTAEGLKKTGFRKLRADEVEALLHPRAEDLVAPPPAVPRRGGPKDRGPRPDRRAGARPLRNRAPREGGRRGAGGLRKGPSRPGRGRRPGPR